MGHGALALLVCPRNRCLACFRGASIRSMSAEIAHRLQLDLVVRDLNQPPEAKDPDRSRTTTAEAPGIPTSRVIGRGQSPRLGLCGGLRRHIDVLEN